MTAVIKKSAIPQLVLTFGTFVEVAAVRAIKLVQSIQYVLRSMAVHQIEENNNAKSVCSIN